MNRSVMRIAPHVSVETRGVMPRGASAYARAKVLAVVARAPEPVLHARVSLTHVGNPAVGRPAIAQANLDVNGRLLRAQIAAGTVREAVDLLQARLRERMVRLARHWEARRGGLPVAEDHEWRHGTVPAERLGFYPRPLEEREIVRHKTFALTRGTPDEAVYDMELLDYQFHLFTEAGTGQDSVVYRDGTGGYRVAQVDPQPAGLGPAAVALTVSEHPAPRLSTSEAVARLELTGWPFVFFVDVATGRANVLYHRYDGHYGLITPSA